MFSEGEAYHRFMGRWSERLASLLVEFAGIGETDRVLDVGAGTGSLARAVLAQSERARVVGIDPSAAALAFAGARVPEAAAAGGAAFERGDAQRLRFGDGEFDAAMSMLVLNFVPDRQAAVREMIRVTRDGGVVAAAVWDYGDGMEMLRVFWDEAVAMDAGAERRDERHMPLCRAGELGAMWRGHRLQDVDERALTIAMEFKSFDDFWMPFLAGQGPAGAYAAGLPEDRRRELGQRLRRRLGGETNHATIQLSARAWAVRGIVPGRDER